MAMTIFFVLNGMGVVFLLFVLVNFWRDGHRPKTFVQEGVVQSLRRNKAEVTVLAPPISPTGQGGFSVIAFPVNGREPAGKSARTTTKGGTVEMRQKKYSTR